MENIVIFGSGGHSKVVIDIIEKVNQFKIIGLVDSFREKGSTVHGYKIIDFEYIAKIKKEIHGGIVAIGDNYIRGKVVKDVTNTFPRFNFINAIHPNSVIGKGVKIGRGSVIMAGAIINTDSIISEHCIINTKSSVGHDCKVGEYATIAPGVTLGGNVEIGNFSAVSLGANIIHKKTVGKHTVIGAGATVVSDIDSYVVAFGTPAKAIRKREIGEKYV